VVSGQSDCTSGTKRDRNEVRGNLEWNPQFGPRQILRWLWIYLLYFSGLIRWARKQVEASGGVIVLTFHRVLDDPAFGISNSPPGMIVRPQTFAALLRFLRKKYEILELTGAAPPWNETLSSRFAITFDDGWKDTSNIVFPLVRELGVPITVFVCPGVMGQTGGFWPEKVVRAWRRANQSMELRERFSEISARAGLKPSFSSHSDVNHPVEALIQYLKDLPADRRNEIVREIDFLQMDFPPPDSSVGVDEIMHWAESARMVAAGTQIGSHTISHEILTTVTKSEVQTELSGSKQMIEDSLGRACKLFAYPNGTWSPHIRDLVQEAGYVQAFANELGIWTAETDPLVIPRVNIWEASVIGPSGQFSPAVFQYATFWRSYRMDARLRKKNCHKLSARPTEGSIKHSGNKYVRNGS
jgi:peptidoglycan/xylan/chitin deacetylase (PgdA/CDA1 family)